MSVNYPFLAFADIPVTTHPLLHSANEKVRWAEMHLATLQSNIWGHFGEPANRPILRADLDEQTGYHVFRIDSVPDYSRFVADGGLAIGDVIGNARAALDHAVWAMVSDGLNGAAHPDERAVAFPIAIDIGRLASSRAGRAIQPYLDPLAWQVIESAALDQNYPGAEGVYGTWATWQTGNDHPIAVLQQLSNDDKHRLLPTLLLLPTVVNFPVYGQVATRTEAVADGTPVDIADTHHAPWGTPVELNAPVHWALFINPPEPHIDHAGEVMPEVALQDMSGVVGTLDRLTCFVKFLLTEFERVLPPKP